MAYFHHVPDVTPHQKKNLIKYGKGGENPLLGKSRPIPGFPCRSPPEQSFPPLVLFIIEIIQNPSHVTLFPEGVLLLYYKLLLGPMLCLVSYSFSGGAKNLEATDGGLNLFFLKQ